MRLDYSGSVLACSKNSKHQTGGITMQFKPTPIASAVAVALSGMAFQVQAQQPPAEAPKKAEVETITVTGIRASLERSIDTKRNADTVVEVISAEDIGKLPDKNIAD